MTTALEDQRNTVVVEGDQVTVVSVGQQGPAGPPGTGAYAAAYGHLLENDQSNTISITDTVTYFPWITGTASGNELHMAVAGGELVIGADGAGLFEVTMQASLGGLGGESVHCTVLKNSVATNIRCERKLGATGDVGSASAVGLVSLGSSDALALGFKADATGTLDIAHFSLTIRRVGEHSHAGTTLLDAIQFNTAAGITGDTVGLLYWNDEDRTLDLVVNGSVLQIGQENHLPALNKTGGTIDDGTPVYLVGAQGDRIEVGVADAAIPAKARCLGVATQDILNNQEGLVTVFGLVRGTNTSAFVEGSVVILADGGGLTSTPPSYPSGGVYIGACIRQHATEGILYVNPFIREINPIGMTDGDVLAIASNAIVPKTPSITVPDNLTDHVDKPSRGLEMAMWGGIDYATTGQALNSGSPVNTTVGCGKLLIVANAGGDPNGTITVTGDTRDRATGAITVGDSEDVVLSGLSTDNSDTDAESNVRHAVVDGYITTKWFQGAITISTADVTLTDVDVALIAFYQFGENLTTVTLQGMDVTGYSSNNSGWLYAYLYSVQVTGSKVTVTREASIEHPSATVTVNQKHRGRITGVDAVLDPEMDGIWLDVIPGPLNQTYWENVSVVIMGSTTVPLNLS